MTRKLKRGISLLLVLCMTLGLLCTGALAEKPETETQSEETTANTEISTETQTDETEPKADDEESSSNIAVAVPADGDNAAPADGDDAAPVDGASDMVQADSEEFSVVTSDVGQTDGTVLLAEQGETHIATYVGQTPDGLNGDFSVPYSTVKATDTDGTEYTVEVVPENLVYFIDQIDYNSGTVSQPYEAVKKLVPALLNDKYDQQSSDGSWGLMGNFKVKSYTDTTVSEKDITGFYGATEAGGTLVYNLPLKAGKYTITSMHYEWWGQTRSMKTSVQTDGVELGTDTIQLNKDSQRSKISFELPQDGTVTYTVLSTGSNAPVISWLGVVKTGDVLPVGPTEVASGTCGTNVTWKLTNNGVLTISGSGKIDDKYARNPAPWSEHKEQIAEAVVEEGITQIGGYAFYQCVNLKKVSLPSTLTNIGGYGSNTFAGCTALTSIEIPASVTTIKASSFAGCTALTSVNIPGGVTKIETSTFSGCVSLTSITIPENVTEIGGSAFNGCTGLTSVTIPAKVKTVGDMAFQNCSKLSNVTFAEGSVLYTLHNTAFNGTAIKTLTIPSGIWNMNSGIYGNLPQLKAIIFEGVPSVTTANTFKNLDISQLTAYVNSAQDYNRLVATKAIATSQGGKPFGTYVLVNKGEIIDAEGSLVKDGYEFQSWAPVEGCEGLVSAVWAEPAPEVIGGYCGKYTPGTDAQWTFDPTTGVLSITGTGWTKEYYAKNPAPWNEYKAQITEVVIGEGITGIGGYSFDKCINLTKVTLPSTLESIGEYSDSTFSGCTALTSIVIPENVTSISGYSFSGCTGLTEITFPGKVTTFGSGIFSGCTGLTRVTLTNGLKETPDFTNCTGLTELVIPDTVTKMGSLAGCSNLRSVNLPSGLKVLPVLSGTAIETLEIPQNTTLSSANGQLANCKNLTTIVGNLLYFNEKQAKSLFRETDVSKITVYAYLYPNQTINNLLSRLSVDYMRDNAKGIYLVRPDETLTQSADDSYILTKDGFNFDGWEWIDTFGNVVAAGDTGAKIQSAKWVCTAHTWNAGEVTTEPTCTTTGVKTYTCPVCGETKTESIDKLAHTPAGAVRENEVAATCTAEGSYVEVVKCSVCGEEISRKTETTAVNPSNHVGETEVRGAKTATCKEEGYTGDTYCKACNNMVEQGKSIEKLAHTPTEAVRENEVSATCTAEGSYDEVVKCSVCGETISSEHKAIEKLAHTEVIDTAVGATCTEPGLTEGKHCSVCGEIINAQQAVPARGHNYGTTWTWTGEDGSVSVVLTCGTCGDKVDNLTAEVTSETTPATATQTGKTVYTATVTYDGKTYTDTHEVTIPATGGGSGGGSSTGGSGDTTVTTYTLTVSYVFEDGSQAASTVRRTLSYGSSYDIASPAIAGYTPSQASVSGTLRASVSVTVTYVKDLEIEDPDTPLTSTPVDTVFADVTKDDWYAAAIQYVYDKGWMSGISGTAFAPNDSTTRGMMATIIYRMESEPEAPSSSFSDVLAGAWYAPAVSWAQKNSVILGYGDGTFGPDKQITREQMVTIIYRYAQLKGYDTTARADLSCYADAGELGDWAEEAMSWAVSVGLIQGTGATTLSPKGSATRAQIALITMRMDQLFRREVIA